MKNYYQHHVFFCTNQRDNGAACCADFNANSLRQYAKQRIQSLQLTGKGGIRINSAGCLDRCNEGPVLVVYPDAVWYSYLDQSDIDEIIDKHLCQGQIVERLRLA